ncbi:divalent-cation tolerance protein CutA [Pontixanthobacter gangjinensis]|uniref:Divalent cation tolerance protein CutA n=1 Tax=Pontixanthobacter gangjinensis TaxID=1028742 RepID=A0A6I4SJX0_9SPHN|nr:divalent-cation tolerance protein CutA [Pontixanthobacter gangjinensis]MXO55738.1 divalent cation tolerance protein CutA [Pontixanthobacter gangjinensis]
MSALIWSPFENIEQARSIAKLLMQEQLIACANFHDGMQSMFVWEGEIDETNECGGLFKTDASLLKAAIKRLEQLHPYQTPAILGWNCEGAGVATQSWLSKLAKGWRQ